MVCDICQEELPLAHHVSRAGTPYTIPIQFCPNCNPYEPGHPRFESRAQTMSNQYPEKNTTLYECPCELPGKLKHHPDYSQPYLIVQLCQRCHMDEHKRINRVFNSQ